MDAMAKYLMANVTRDDNGGGHGTEDQTCDMALRGVSLLPTHTRVSALSLASVGTASLDGESSHLSWRLRDSVTLVTLVARGACRRCADRTSRVLEPVQPSAPGVKARMAARGSRWWTAVGSSGWRVRTVRGARARARAVARGPRRKKARWCLSRGYSHCTLKRGSQTLFRGGGLHGPEQQPIRAGSPLSY